MDVFVAPVIWSTGCEAQINNLYFGLGVSRGCSTACRVVITRNMKTHRACLHLPFSWAWQEKYHLSCSLGTIASDADGMTNKTSKAHPYCPGSPPFHPNRHETTVDLEWLNSTRTRNTSIFALHCWAIAGASLIWRNMSSWNIGHDMH